MDRSVACTDSGGGAVVGAGARKNAGANNTADVKSCAVVLTGCFGGMVRRAPGLTLMVAVAGHETLAGRVTLAD